MSIVDPAIAFRKYQSTSSSCHCPDHKFRKRICKHMILFQKIIKVLNPTDLLFLTAGFTGRITLQVIVINENMFVSDGLLMIPLQNQN
jgi:hypothetical protein